MTDKQTMSLIKYKWKRFYPNVKLSYRIKSSTFGKTIFLLCTFGKYSKSLYFKYRDHENLGYALEMFESEFKKSALRIFLESLVSKTK